MTAIVVKVTVLATQNLLAGEAVVVSAIWLVFMAYQARASCKEAGGLQRWIKDMLGVIAWSHFVRYVTPASGAREIRFGYYLFGHPVFYRSFTLSQVESVHWSQGQGHGWIVFLECDYYDPSIGDQPLRMPAKDRYWVGPALRRAKAEALGLALVQFLNRAGASLVLRGSRTRVHLPGAIDSGRQTWVAARLVSAVDPGGEGRSQP